MPHGTVALSIIRLLVDLLRLAALCSFAGRCGICDSPFKRTKYRWTIRDQQVWLCPHCNSRLERQQSKIAFDPNAVLNIPYIPNRPGSGGGVGVLLSLLVVCVGAFIWFFANGPERATSNDASETTSRSNPAFVIHATPKPLPRDVTLTAPIRMPVTVGGKLSGTITLPRGTHVELLSAGRDTVVVRYSDSTATVPIAATDLRTFQ